MESSSASGSVVYFDAASAGFRNGCSICDDGAGYAVYGKNQLEVFSRSFWGSVGGLSADLDISA